MKQVRIVGIVSLVLVLAACGFQLRGLQDSVASRYASMRLITHGSDEAFFTILRQNLKNAGVTLNEDAEAILDIQSVRTEKRTASYNSRAKSAEFELLKRVTFQFHQGKRERIAPMIVQVRRSYLYRETAAVGKAEEERLLWREMDDDLAQRILIALQHSVRPVANSETAAPTGAAVAPTQSEPVPTQSSPLPTPEPVAPTQSNPVPTQSEPLPTPSDPAPAPAPPASTSGDAAP